MWEIFLGIWINYLIFTIWLWIARSLFGNMTIKRLIQSLVLSGIIIAILWTASQDVIIDYFWLSIYIYLNSILALVMIAMNTVHWLQDHPNKVSYSLRSVSWILLISLIHRLLPESEIAVTLLFLAMIEEFLKHSGSISLQVDDKYPSTLIGIAIVVALWFAWWENIVYMIQWTGNIVWLSFWRGLTGFLAHTIFWGLIAYIISWAKNHSYTWVRLFAMMWLSLLVWSLVHFAYNYSLQSWYMLLYLSLILWGYVFLSFLFYRTDRIYVNR